MTGKVESTRPAGHELLITRSFDAPVSLLFRIWAQRERMIRWSARSGNRESACGCQNSPPSSGTGNTWRSASRLAT